MGSLGNTLKMLASSGSIDETIIIPEEDITVEDIPVSTSKKKKKEKSITDQVSQFLEKAGVTDDIIDSAFDIMMESFNSDDEDIELRNSLVSMGRKYERETRMSAETSEIQKAFSGSVKQINGLIEEVRKDKAILQQDLDYLHATRTRNSKAISDTYEVKSSLHNLELQAIKELNSMTKTQIDLQLKAKAQKNDDLVASGMNGNLIQDLFNVGRKNIIDGIGGYAGISGADTSDDAEETTKEKSSNVSPDIVYNDDDDYIRQKYIVGEDFDAEESDGEKFLKYRDAGVHYVLDLTSGEKDIYAEDQDGNRVLDYPMPSKIEDLSFDIDDREGVAYDDFHRTYTLRK